MKAALTAILLLTAVLGQNLALSAGAATTTLSAVADGYADSKYPRSAYGRVSALYVGNSYDRAQNLWGSERIYIRFDLSQIPRGRSIVGATLRLWQYYAPSIQQEYEVHRVLEDWNEATECWDNQPKWSDIKTSSAIAPPVAEVPVEWNITSDARAWYSAEARNYGVMIKVAEEKHVAEASSGFWAREYPAEEWKPMLVLVLQGEPTLTYTVTLAVSGLPAGVTSTATVDGKSSISISSAAIDMIFDSGTAHSITVTQVVATTNTTKYVCADNQLRVSETMLHVFTYAPEYWVTYLGKPSNLFQTPPNGWYPGGSTVTVNRTGADCIDTDHGRRLVFDGWYVNSEKLNEMPSCACQKVEPVIIQVNGPATIEGRYRTEYYLNVTSPMGNTQGSGWYPEGSTVSFSLDRSEVPAQGIPGLIGLKWILVEWKGSSSFLGLPVGTQGSLALKGPTNLVAVWREDRSVSLQYAGLLVAAIIVVLVILALRVRRRGADNRMSEATLSRSRKS